MDELIAHMRLLQGRRAGSVLAQSQSHCSNNLSQNFASDTHRVAETVSQHKLTKLHALTDGTNITRVTTFAASKSGYPEARQALRTGKQHVLAITQLCCSRSQQQQKMCPAEGVYSSSGLPQLNLLWRKDVKHHVLSESPLACFA